MYLWAFISAMSAEYLYNNIAVNAGREREYLGTQRINTSIREKNSEEQ